MVGRDIEPARRRDVSQASDVVLETKQLSLAWPGHSRGWRLKDVSFQLHRGEILGFAGLMGAGRTELLECLFGASNPPPEGQLLVHGTPRSFAHPPKRCKLESRW